jgi:hypothetical protein
MPCSSRSPDHVGTRSARGQFRQMGEVRQLVEDHRQRAIDVVAGQRPDPGRHSSR